MEELSGIFITNPEKHLLLIPSMVKTVNSLHSGLSKFVSLALNSGAHIPVISTALNYINGFSSSQSSANLIQAQRDYFGSHTYKRNDKPSTEIFHTNWLE